MSQMHLFAGVLLTCIVQPIFLNICSKYFSVQGIFLAQLLLLMQVSIKMCTLLLWWGLIAWRWITFICASGRAMMQLLYKIEMHLRRPFKESVTGYFWYIPKKHCHTLLFFFIVSNKLRLYQSLIFAHCTLSPIFVGCFYSECHCMLRLCC